MCSECELFCILYYPCVLAFLEIETEISYLQDFNIFQLSHSHRIIEIGQVILANLDQTLYFRNNIERLKVLFIYMYVCYVIYNIYEHNMISPPHSNNFSGYSAFHWIFCVHPSSSDWLSPSWSKVFFEQIKKQGQKKFN